jgi:hypothetical protein
VVPLVKTDTQIAALYHSTMQSGSRSGARIPLSGTGSPEESEQDTSVSHASLRIGIVLHRLTDGCPTRVNTLNSFLDANRRVCSSDHGRARALVSHQSPRLYCPPTTPTRLRQSLIADHWLMSRRRSLLTAWWEILPRLGSALLSRSPSSGNTVPSERW